MFYIMLKAFLIVFVGVSYICYPYTGIKADISINKLNQLIKELYPVLNELIQRVEIKESIQVNDVKINSVIVESRIKKRNGIVLLKDGAYLILDLKQVEIQTKLEIQKDLVIFDESGTVEAKSLIKSVKFRINQQDSQNTPQTPLLSLKLMELIIDKESFAFSFDFEHIPSFASNLIIKLFKERIFDMIIDKLTLNINNKGNKVLNSLIQKHYPTEVELKHKVVLRTNLIDRIDFTDERVIGFSISGLFYKKARDLHELTGNADKLVNLYLFENSVNSLFNALYNEEIVFGNKEKRVTFMTREAKPYISFRDGYVEMKKLPVKFRIVYPNNYIELDSIVNCNLTLLEIDLNTSKLLITINDLSFDEFNIESDYFLLDKLSFITKYGIYLYLKIKNTFQFTLPKISHSFPFNTHSFDFNVKSGYMNVSFDLNIKGFVTDFLLKKKE